jgi:hypothetical protein
MSLYYLGREIDKLTRGENEEREDVRDAGMMQCI